MGFSVAGKEYMYYIYNNIYIIYTTFCLLATSVLPSLPNQEPGSGRDFSPLFSIPVALLQELCKSRAVLLSGLALGSALFSEMLVLNIIFLGFLQKFIEVRSYFEYFSQCSQSQDPEKFSAHWGSLSCWEALNQLGTSQLFLCFAFFNGSICSEAKKGHFQ